MDLSCRIEAERMHADLPRRAHAGAILPGNHDGLMFGIYGYNVLDAVFDTGATEVEPCLPRAARHRTTNHRPTARR